MLHLLVRTRTQCYIVSMPVGPLPTHFSCCKSHFFSGEGAGRIYFVLYMYIISCYQTSPFDFTAVSCFKILYVLGLEPTMLVSVILLLLVVDGHCLARF
jgi:hypothetical protein